MSRKNLVVLIGAALAFAGSNAAFACSRDAWAATPGGAIVGNPIAAQPDDATAANRTARYSGKCGLKATAPNNYVRDGSPNGESSYRARFYVFTGVTGGEAIVFRAANAANADRIRVGINGTTMNFYADADAVADATIPGLQANRWYSVELNHSGASVGYTVQGASPGSATAAVPVTGNFAITGGVIDTAELGWITGAATGTVLVDAFESRRSTAIGRLCRGDANADGLYGVQDRIIMTNEILRINGVLAGQNPAQTIAAGQPDCEENGTVGASDRICVTNFIVANPPRTCSNT